MLKTTLLTILIVSSALAQKNISPARNSDIANIGTRDINKGNLNFMSFEKEISLGRELSAEFERRVTLVNDSVVDRYVEQLGQRIAVNSDIKVPVSIKVVESMDINIYALPGGLIYLNTELIRTADNEAELGFAISQAVAHIAARHAAENASKGQLLNYSTIPLMSSFGPTTFTLQQESGRQRLVPIALYSFYRTSVKEADYLGTQYLYKAGYDPGAAVTLLEKLQALETATPAPSTSKEFTTHPPTLERIQLIRETIARILPPRYGSVVTTDEFAAVKARIR